MNPQAASAQVNVLLEDGEILSPRIGTPRICSPRVVSPLVASPRIGCPRVVANGNPFEPASSRRYANAVMGIKARKRAEVVDWLNGIFQALRIPADASEEDLRRRLVDGTVLCGIIKKLNPDFLLEGNSNVGRDFPRNVDSPRYAVLSAKQRSENVKKFLSALDKLGLPKFDPLELEQGPITDIVECLLNLRDHFTTDAKGSNQMHRRAFSEGCLKEDNGNDIQANGHIVLQNGRSDSRSQGVMKTPVVSGQKTEGCNSEFRPSKSGVMNLHSFDNAPTPSLISLLNSILGEKENGELPTHIEMFMRKVMQELERRLSTQAEHIRKLKLSLKEVLAREERLVSRAGTLEMLAAGTSEEIQVVTNQLHKTKAEKGIMEEKWKLVEQDVRRLRKDKEEIELELSSLNQELETTKRSYEAHCLHLEARSKDSVQELQEKTKHLEFCLAESKRNLEVLEEFGESWKLKTLGYQRLMDNQQQALADLRLISQAAKKEILDSQGRWLEEISNLGVNLNGLAEAAQNYHTVLEENRRLYNEVQDLKGSIRVYCRVRPFLGNEAAKQSIIEYIGEDGEFLISNPSRHGKDGQHMFKFNKVYGPTATQEEVFMDTKPLIRSVLDGFNVCIFAYGQTGSGKTFTMIGPDPPTKETWGVNYRALNDLFLLSQKRKTTYSYEVVVQMVEIYNEQVRDLLTTDGPRKKLGILSSSHQIGPSVPDAIMHQVNSAADVIALMDMGKSNMVVSATAMNERSSRSHSVLTVHVRATELETGVVLRGSLHLVDLAGSERIDRSEATGDRLKEAQHINKSLSSLGDVIYSLAKKNAHIPYRNSKLTQILQSSLGGQAKTLMFVQLNPDIGSYSESLSSLKFAERVSGIELGVAKNNKEHRERRHLMEQVAQLKELVAKKDSEIERLQSFKNHSPRSLLAILEKRSTKSHKSTLSLSPPKRASLGVSVDNGRRSSTGGIKKLPSGSGVVDVSPRNATHRKTSSDWDCNSEFSDRHSEISSVASFDDFRVQEEFSQQPKPFNVDLNKDQEDDTELLGFVDGDEEERLSDISDSCLSIGTETDGSISSIVEYNLFPESANDSNNPVKSCRSKLPTHLPRPQLKSMQSVPACPLSGTRQSISSRPLSSAKDRLKASTGFRRSTMNQVSAPTVKSTRRWQ